MSKQIKIVAEIEIKEKTLADDLKRRTWGNIVLLTPEEFASLPNGTVVTSISERKYIKGQDYIDDDTRGGCLAFGFPTSEVLQNDKGKFDFLVAKL